MPSKFVRLTIAASVLVGCCFAAHAATSIASIPGTRGIRIVGQVAGDALASNSSMSEIGDINGDGRADLAVPSPGKARGAALSVGTVYVFFGRDGALSNLDISSATGSGGFTITASTSPANTLVGSWTNGVGDVNNDGNPDFLIGTGFNFAGAGRVFLIFGKGVGQSFPNTLDVDNLGSNGVVITGGGANADGFGSSAMVGAGDVTGDGIFDLVLGAQSADGNSGFAYLIAGRSNWGTSFSVGGASNVFTFTSERVADQLGAHTAIVDDINNDQRADIFVNAFSADVVLTPNPGNEGKIFVLFGRDAATPWTNIAVGSLNGSNGFQVRGTTLNGGFGLPSTGLGDFNGDGVSDFAAAAVLAIATSQSTIGVFYGKANWDATVDLASLNGTNGFRLIGQMGEIAGAFLLGPGDLNGDGLSEILLSAPGADLPNLTNAGRVYVINGSTTTFGADTNLSAVEGVVAGEIFTGATAGFAAGPIGTVGKFSNADARPDFLIGSETTLGDAYLVTRSSDVQFANGFE